MAYISEIKSRDDPTSASDYVEVVVAPGEDAFEFELDLYRRNGDLLSTTELDPSMLTQTLADGSQVYIVQLRLWEGGNPNGPAAVALTSDTDGVVQFIAAGTTDVTADGGAADGLVATAFGNSAAGDSHFWADDGTYLGTDPSTRGVICFAMGTWISTKRGPQLVEHLCIDDQVLTRDNGYQFVRWIGVAHRSKLETARHENLRPVVVRRDAFGPNCPSQDLRMSPQHRVLSTSAANNLLFNETETLIAVKQMLNDTNITSSAACDVTYFHLMFDQHQIIRSNNVWTESFLPNEYGLSTIGDVARAEFDVLFPEFRQAHSESTNVATRYVLKTFEAKVLLAANGATN